MVIGSLFGLSHLSLLVEVVRMFEWGKEGKADEGCRSGCFVGWVPFVASARKGRSDGSGAVGCRVSTA
jgi:hypothetical protein